MMLVGIFIGFLAFCMLWMAWLGPAMAEVMLTKYSVEAARRFCRWEARIIGVVIVLLVLVLLYVIFDGFVCALSYGQPALCKYITY